MMTKGFHHKDVVNYFVVIHGEFQKNTAERLTSKFNLSKNFNIMIFRYPFGKKPKIIRSDIYSKYFAIPHFTSDFKVLKWLNFFIYIFSFSVIHLLFFKRSKNLVIGNLLYNGNKFICNQFDWNDIFILDEGASTLPLFDKRNNNLKEKKYRILDKILRTYEPNKKLNFFTKYNIPENNFDKIYRYQSFVFDGINNKIKINSNKLLFVGSPLVEKNIIAQHRFEELLRIICSVNKNLEIHYAPHPRENLIFEIISSYSPIHIIKIDRTIEDFIQENYENYRVISSCISSGFINIYQGFKNYFEYQTYVFDTSMIKPKNRQSMQSFYEAIKKDKDYLDLSNDFILINE